jgi:hypothetical protein
MREHRSPYLVVIPTRASLKRVYHEFAVVVGCQVGGFKHVPDSEAGSRSESRSQ